MSVSWWIWALLMLAIAAMLAVDLFLHRDNHVVGFREAAAWSGIWVAAGLLFGPLLGVSIAVVASTVSAVLAVLLVRAVGWQLSRLTLNPRVESLDSRLRERGWVTVLSMRMIPAVPFAVLNYAAGASAVRLLPYTVATLIGVFPGTAAVVILGDALTGNVSPLLLVVSACTASIGVAGLIYELRAHRHAHAHGVPDENPAVNG